MKNMTSADTNNEGEFLFNVDIMIHSKSNALALQSLLEMLNAQDQIADFRIQSGIKLGTRIEQALKQSAVSDLNLKPIHKSAPDSSSESTYKEEVDRSPSEKWFVTAMKEGRLIRLDIRDKSGKGKSLPCRVLNFDAISKLVSIYHVDEKQVYSIHTSEIEKYI